MPDESELIALRAAAHTEVGCTFVMFRGAMTGRVITCGVCAWCRDSANADRFEEVPNG